MIRSYNTQVIGRRYPISPMISSRLLSWIRNHSSSSSSSSNGNGSKIIMAAAASINRKNPATTFFSSDTTIPSISTSTIASTTGSSNHRKNRKVVFPSSSSSSSKQFLSPHSLSSILTTNHTMNQSSQSSTEDALLAQTDPWALLQPYLHPIIIRSFKQIQSTSSIDYESQYTNKTYTKLFTLTEEVLLDWKKQLMHKNEGQIHFEKIPMYKEYFSISNQVDPLFLPTIQSIQTEIELKGLITFLYIFLPKKPLIWYEFDNMMVKRFKSYSMEVNLLATYVIQMVHEKLCLDKNRSRFPQLFLNHYVINPSLLEKEDNVNNSASNSASSSNSKEENNEDNNDEIQNNNSNTNSNINDKETFFPSLSYYYGSHELFSSVGSLQAQDNLSLEILSMQLTLFARSTNLNSNVYNNSNTERNNNLNNRNINSNIVIPKHISEKLSMHALKLLSIHTSPTRIFTLRTIWEQLTQLNLPNAYNIYNALYQQVLTSIIADPYQIFYDEEIIISLLDCMHKSKHKNSKIIDQLYEIIRTRGIYYDKYGLPLFNLLVELNAIPFSSYVLQRVLPSLTNHKKGSFTFKSKLGLSLSISDTTKKNVYKFITQTSNSSISSSPTSSVVGDEVVTDNDEIEINDNNASNELINNPINKINYEDSNSKSDSKGITWTADDVKEAKRKLILALIFFNKEDKDRKTNYHRLLNTLESDFLMMQIHHKLTVEEALHIYYVYALFGRLNINLINLLDEFIANNMNSPSMINKNIATIIWCCSRLNHRPNYLYHLSETYFHQISNVSALSSNGGYGLSKTLWALAVLQLLNEDKLLQVSQKLFKSLKLKHIYPSESWLIRQMIQIKNELCIMKEQKQQQQQLLTQSIEAKDNGSDSNSSEHTNDSKIQNQHKYDQSISSINDMITKIDEFLFFNRNVKHSTSQQLLQEISTSYTHLDASKMLSLLGVIHQNEKLLDIGYMVDIFIPRVPLDDEADNDTSRHNDKNSNQKFKGTVLEFDGPSHFESYLSRPLGPTKMKRRHIEKAGYKLININYRDYKVQMTKQQKLKLLKQYLNEADIKYIDNTE